ncbi:hypothetical protein BC830DRAFT_1218360 [Chytriomyces sp. MP71]|nr:hypothetical protein BC830DRAFT_1218360 [Chytriomyces sp. MP71]
MSTAAADCAVLQKSFTSLMPPSGKDCCSISGIVCQNGRIVQVDLNGKAVTGVLPDFSQLTELQKFLVPSNDISGPIPESVASLTKLTMFDIGLNQISGNVPNSLSGMSSLTALYIGFNKLVGPMPTTVSSLTQLAVINMQNNFLTGSLPTSIGKLTQLTELELSNNQLSGSIPTELGLLLRAEIFDLAHNNLTGSIPTELLNLPAGTFMNLEQNLLSGALPSIFINRNLNASVNCIDGQNGTNRNPYCGFAVPASSGSSNAGLIGGIVGGIVALLLIATGILFYIRRSRKTSNTDHEFDAQAISPSVPANYPPSVTAQTTLTHEPNLGLASPQELLAVFPQLHDAKTETTSDGYNSNDRGASPLPVKHVHRAERPLHRVLDETFSETATESTGTPGPSLLDLKMGEKQESDPTGWSSAEVSKWAMTIPKVGPSLAAKVEEHGISGADLFKLTNEHMRDDLGLVKLNDRIALTEAIERLRPRRCKNSSHLNPRIFREWLVQGVAAPFDCAALLQGFASLHVSFTKDCCSIGGITCQKGRIVQVHMEDQGITGSLPDFSLLKELQSFIVPSNNISGVIPSSIGLLNKLTLLDIGLNSISGPLPTSLTSMKSLTHLSVGFNNLSGTIPYELSALAALKVANFEHNSLTGGIPTALGKLTQLAHLDLSYNHITGSIPTEFELLIRLDELHLENNMLTGGMPIGLLKLPPSGMILGGRIWNVSTNCLDDQAGQERNPACGPIHTSAISQSNQSNNALIGSLVGGIIALLLLSSAIFFCCQGRHRRQKQLRSSEKEYSYVTDSKTWYTPPPSYDATRSIDYGNVDPDELISILPLPEKDDLFSDTFSLNSTIPDKKVPHEDFETSPANWSCADVANWAKSISTNGAVLSMLIEEHEINGATLFKLTDDHLREDLGLVATKDRLEVKAAIERIRP